MHRTRLAAGNDLAIAFLPVILLVGTTVAMTAVGFTVMQVDTPEAGPVTGMLVRNQPDALRVVLTSGEPVPVSGAHVVIEQSDGEKGYALATLGPQLGATWDRGETLCLAGTGTTCDHGIDASAITGFRVVSEGHLLREWTGAAKASSSPAGGGAGGAGGAGGPGGGSGGPGGGSGGGGGGQVTICHIPPGNPDAQHTITVGAPAVGAHLDHGDHRGPCEE